MLIRTFIGLLLVETLLCDEAQPSDVTLNKVCLAEGTVVRLRSAQLPLPLAVECSVESKDCCCCDGVCCLWVFGVFLHRGYEGTDAVLWLVLSTMWTSSREVNCAEGLGVRSCALDLDNPPKTTAAEPTPPTCSLTTVHRHHPSAACFGHTCGSSFRTPVPSRPESGQMPSNCLSDPRDPSDRFLTTVLVVKNALVVCTPFY